MSDVARSRITTAPGHRWTLGEAVERWLNARHGWAPLTINRYTKTIGRFMNAMGGPDVALDQITALDYEEWIRDLAPLRGGRCTEYTPQSRNMAGQPVRAFFAWCQRLRMIDWDPTVDVALERVQSAPPKRLSREAVRRLVDMSSPPGRVRLTLFATYGLRLAELTRLRVTDWDRESDLLTILGKGGKTRVLPLVGSALRELTWWVDSYLQAADGPMWPSPSPHKLGLPLSATWIGREVTLTGERCRPPIAVHPHLLRHFALATMVEQGYDLATVQYIAGHASLATTTIYTRAAPEHVRARLVDGGWSDWLQG